MTQLFELVDYQEYNESIPVTNIYHYFHDGESEITAQSLVDSWVTNVLPFVREVQGGVIAHLAVGAVELTNPLNAHLRELVGVIGNAPGDGQPSFSTYSFTCSTPGNAMNAGGKRYAGTTDDTVSNNSATAVVATDLANLGEVLPLPLAIAGELLQYVIKRIVSPGVYDIASVAIAIFRAISTQNSRKAGASEFSQPGIYWSRETATPTFPVDPGALLASLSGALSGQTVRRTFGELDTVTSTYVEVAGINYTFP